MDKDYTSEKTTSVIAQTRILYHLPAFNMKTKALSFVVIIAAIVLICCIFMFRNSGIQTDTDQVAELPRNKKLENQADLETSASKAHKNSMGKYIDLEKNYPRSGKITWLTDDDIKRTDIDIKKIEEGICHGGNIPFSLKIKPSEYKIGNKYHAASLLFFSFSQERYHHPQYGYETDKYYLFFYLNKDMNEVRWDYGQSIQKESPCWASSWNFSLSN